MTEKPTEKPKTPPKTSDHRKLHAWILWIVGIILIIAGIAIATIHGTHLRGSGLGTALIVLGFIMFVIGVIRYMYKKPQ